MKQYIKPAIKALTLDTESAILDTSFGVSDQYSGPAGIKMRTIIEENEFEDY